MAEILKKETPVRLIQPVIEGKVLKADIQNEEVCYLVEYTGVDGAVHQRFFPASVLEVVKEE